MLAVLEPTGLDAGVLLETVGLLNGLVISLVRAELADRTAPPDPAQAELSAARLQDLLGTGHYARVAAALAGGGPPEIDLSEHFDRLVDRIADGLLGA